MDQFSNDATLISPTPGINCENLGEDLVEQKFQNDFGRQEIMGDSNVEVKPAKHTSSQNIGFSFNTKAFCTDTIRLKDGDQLSSANSTPCLSSENILKNLKEMSLELPFTIGDIKGLPKRKVIQPSNTASSKQMTETENGNYAHFGGTDFSPMPLDDKFLPTFNSLDPSMIDQDVSDWSYRNRSYGAKSHRAHRNKESRPHFNNFHSKPYNKDHNIRGNNICYSNNADSQLNGNESQTFIDSNFNSPFASSMDCSSIDLEYLRSQIDVAESTLNPNANIFVPRDARFF